MSTPDAASVERYLLNTLVPGLRGVFVFAALVVVGFGIWLASSPGVAERLFGFDLPAWPTWMEDSFFLLILVWTGLRSGVALSAGFLFPRGFLLWGLAIVIHTPLTQWLTARAMIQEGIDPFVGGTEGMLNYLIIDTLLTAMMAVFYTCLAGAGALARYLISGRTPGYGTPDRR